MLREVTRLGSRPLITLATSHSPLDLIGLQATVCEGDVERISLIGLLHLHYYEAKWTLDQVMAVALSPFCAPLFASLPSFSSRQGHHSAKIPTYPDRGLQKCYLQHVEYCLTSGSIISCCWEAPKLDAFAVQVSDRWQAHGARPVQSE